MSMKSRGRSPGGGGHPRHADVPGAHPRHTEVAGRGGSLGPGHAGSSYSSETEEMLLNDSHQGSNNTSPSHTLAGHANTSHNQGESNSIWYDEFDSSGLAPEKKQKALDFFQAKMNKTKELIKHEQNSRDANVDEYLRLSSCADRHQLARIKQVFEKKNQKSAQSIAQLQKKLENYQKKVRDIEQGTLPRLPNSKRPKEIVNEVLNKPKDMIHLIKNKFGSADHINKEGARSDSGDRGREGTPTHHRNHGHKRTQSGHIGSSWNSHVKQTSASLPRDAGGSGGSVPSDHRQSAGDSGNSDVTSESDHVGNVSQPVPGHVSDTSRRASGANVTDREPGHPQPLSSLELQSIMDEIHERREECDKLARELEIQRQHFKQELEFLGTQLREGAIRCEKLEEQMNDLTELHQHEIENIKTGVTDMEEKVLYQSEDRVRDIQEQLATLEARMSRMEHQAAQSIIPEGIDNNNAIVVKGINVLLTLLQVLLLILATAAQILKPFLRTPTRVVTTVLLITVLVLAVRQWGEIKEFSVNFASKVKNSADKEKVRDL